MKRYLGTPLAVGCLLRLALIASLALPLPSIAASVALATAPLAKATTTSVLPNLMFVLDNSGSMGWDYLPDWANDSYCKGNMPTSTGATSSCYTSSRGRPPFYNPDFNRIYYDPAITYKVPVDYAGNNKTSYTGTTAVPVDGYGIQSTSTLLLTSNYPDLEYCTDSSYSDCLRNDNYLLPGTVNGKNYTTAHATTASGSKSFATGTIASPTNTSGTAGPYYYVIVPGEYCSDRDQTTCVAATAPSATYPYAATVRWCLNSDLTNCKLLQDTAYKFVRYPTIVTQAATPAGSSIGKITASGMPRSTRVGGVRPTCTITSSSTTCNATDTANCKVDPNRAEITSVKLANGSHPMPGTELLTQSFTYCNGNNSQSNRDEGLASALQGFIGNGFTSTRSINVLTITAPDGTYNSASGNFSLTSANLDVTTAFAGGSTGTGPIAVPGAFKRINIISGQTYGNVVVGGQTVVDRSKRDDCAAKPNCTYEEELANFANWYAWYHTRMQMMKTSASRAFKAIDSRYRVGFYTINNSASNYLKIDTFTSGAGNQKDKWYAKLFAANPGSSTPLRSTLSEVGRVFAGKNPLGVSGGDDPMQYSCQQNFTLLTTDGYWNSDAASDIKTISGGTMGNLDGGSTPRPMFEGPVASSGSLADTAKYYYDTDLRTSTLGNCTGSLGLDVCDNNVFVSSTDNNVQQHMTTFTLGLGVDGTLAYQSDYKTATSGDYYLLSKGLSKNVNGVDVPVNWPEPKADSASAIDDLWHAAVNGQGTYFGAKNPTELAAGLNDALNTIGAKLGSGAAAATSTLDITRTDNYAYLATYTTVKWTGNLQARSIDIYSGEPSLTASWCAENVISGSCVAPGAVVAEVTGGGSTVNYCVTPVPSTPIPSSTDCTGVMDGTNCKVEMAVSCTGTMASKVAASSDTRTIKMNKGGALDDFTYANLTPTQQGYFTATGLSQWSMLTTAQQTAAAGSNLVNFLRGQNGYEDRASNLVDNRIYRYREAVLGDVVESRPYFVGKPIFSYTDTDYSAFVTAKTSRLRTVYMGANDGMLHAFNADTGEERWAFVPSMVIPNMWKLADKNYATMHSYYVNGNPIVGDVYNGSSWRTILVGGLNGGGRGYYALDITDPLNPSLLWEFTSNSSDTLHDDDLGYSFGQPVITKKADGTWVVLMTSGYNNTSPGNGRGYLYVRNALTGAHISKISTGVGDTTTPSGLARIATWADDPEKNNTAGYTYGGDLLGNLWRFNINTGAVLKFAELKDSNGDPQPITARPTLGKIKEKRVVFVGTGKFLELLDLTTTQQQSVYAIKDDEATTTLVNPRTTLVQQTLTNSGTSATRTGSSNPVNFDTGRGWFADFPDSGERVDVNPLLAYGKLLVPTVMPESTVCSPGGRSWFNVFDYKTGAATGERFDETIVGLTVVVTSAEPDPAHPDDPPVAGSGKPVVLLTTGTGDIKLPTDDPLSKDSGNSFRNKRVIWRELIQ